MRCRGACVGRGARRPSAADPSPISHRLALAACCCTENKARRLCTFRPQRPRRRLALSSPPRSPSTSTGSGASHSLPSGTRCTPSSRTAKTSFARCALHLFVFAKTYGARWLAKEVGGRIAEREGCGRMAAVSEIAAASAPPLRCAGQRLHGQGGGRRSSLFAPPGSTLPQTVSARQPTIHGFLRLPFPFSAVADRLHPTCIHPLPTRSYIMREKNLWHDPPDYYASQTRFLRLSSALPTKTGLLSEGGYTPSRRWRALALSSCRPSHRSPSTRPGHVIPPPTYPPLLTTFSRLASFEMISLQLREFTAAAMLASALNRTLLLPQLKCGDQPMAYPCYAWYHRAMAYFGWAMSQRVNMPRTCPLYYWLSEEKLHACVWGRGDAGG